MRPFRFGYQTRGGTADDLREHARRAEAAGFDIIQSADHLSPGWSPTLPLLAMAEATTTLRVGSLVINNDFRHPALLAAEYANLDHLTGGRVELGIGAGHSFTEYAAMGLTFDPPKVRKARLRESIEIVRSLLDGDSVTFTGEYYQLREVRTMRSLQDRLPIMAGVGGPAALAHAAQHADIIGLMMLGRTLPDGHQHEVRWEADRLDRTVAYIREHSGARDVELNALVQMVQVTDDREGALRKLVTDMPSLTPDDAERTPFLAFGTYDEIAAHLVRCRERWGINYFSVRTIDDFQPVIERLRALDA